MKISKAQTIPDHNLDDDHDSEECLYCGCVDELDVNGRCYDCGYEDAHDYERENDY